MRHLRAFTTLADELHFGRAAQRLNLTQPALSQMLRELETRIGARLVERTTRRVVLTDLGEAFLPEAQALLQGFEQAFERARVASGQDVDVIRIGAIMSTTFAFLPEVLIRFRRRYPAIRIEIESKQSRELVTAVEKGALHAALVRPPRNPGSLHLATLLRERFVAAVPAGHALAVRPDLTLPDLIGERLVRISRADLRDAFGEVDRELTSAGLEVATAQSVDSTLTALALVAAGDGVSLVPDWAAALAWTGVAFRPVTDLQARIELAAAWTGASPPPAVQHFLDVAARTGAGA